ncbi:hypothetical protein [Amycolatopsis sp. SID8362]|uniref:hypothetical protein n=1 Tax=Amycolatopsis sp. SID8362 TaxID=2690346 RepID=UPI001943AAA3|nr:hypothetical protein [Amycolatopsis sp. SID8362]
MSSTANSRRSAPRRPVFTAGEDRRETVEGAVAGHFRARGRAPRPWAGALQRPAAKILVAGGLTLAGWLLTAALSGSTAGAVEQAACPQAPVASTVDHAAKPFSHAKHHRKSHRETGAVACAQQPGETAATDPAGTTQADGTAADGPLSDITAAGTPATDTTLSETAAGKTQPADTAAADTTASDATTAGTPATESTPTETKPVNSTAADTTPGEAAATDTTPVETVPAAKTQPAQGTTTAEQPAANTQTTQPQTGLLSGLVGGVLNTDTQTTSQTGLLGGLVGGVLNVVGGTLTTVTSTVGVVTDTLSHTVLAPLTQPPANNPGAPVLLPLDDVLGPIFNGGSNSGGVTVTVPSATTLVATVPAEAPAAVVTAPVEAAPQSAARGAARFVVVRHEVPQQVKQELPRDSGVHARDGGGDTTPGLPGGTTAPSAPAPTATPGHDGPGGARHAFAVHTDDVTTTQLKLIGTSRDHDVDGAGREAALPTTSPD